MGIWIPEPTMILNFKNLCKKNCMTFPYNEFWVFQKVEFSKKYTTVFYFFF